MDVLKGDPFLPTFSPRKYIGLFGQVSFTIHASKYPNKALSQRA